MGIHGEEGESFCVTCLQTQHTVNVGTVAMGGLLDDAHCNGLLKVVQLGASLGVNDADAMTE
jgi:hypothetical protein